VEDELNRNATVRQEMETLKRAWDLLDYLPRPEAPQSFTQKTVERLSALRVEAIQRARRLKWLGRLAWAASLAFVGLMTGWAVYRTTPAVPTSTTELQVLEYRDTWPYFLESESVEFLKALDKPDLFGEDS
jgi:hypothetical protein